MPNNVIIIQDSDDEQDYVDNNTAPHHPEPLHKGKARAPTERTPLLHNNHYSPPTISHTSSHALNDNDDDDDDEGLSPTTYRQRRHQLHAKLTLVFLASLTFCIFFFLFCVLLAWSYAAHVASLSPDELVKKGFIFRGPDRVEVLNYTAPTTAGSSTKAGVGPGVWLNVEGRVGIDAGALIGTSTSTEEKGDGLFRRWWKALGRFGVRKLASVSLEFSTITIRPGEVGGEPLVFVNAPPVDVVLHAAVDATEDASWLRKVEIPIFVRMNSNTSYLVEFLTDSWKNGAVQVTVEVATVSVAASVHHGWRSLLHRSLKEVRTRHLIEIPSLPGLPLPGHDFPPLSDLIHLDAFSVSTVDSQIHLQASATVPNPIPPTLNLTIPLLPFTVLLPNHSSPVPIASVNTLPFTTATTTMFADNVDNKLSLSITGTVLPFPPHSTPLLSSFLSRYLSSLPNPILLTSPLLSPPPSSPPYSPSSPPFTFPALFPAPSPKPQVLQNVTLTGMSVKKSTTTTGGWLASGVVRARVVLPKGIEVGLDVKGVLPDILIFDGEVPEEEGESENGDGDEHDFDFDFDEQEEVEGGWVLVGVRERGGREGRYTDLDSLGWPWPKRPRPHKGTGDKGKGGGDGEERRKKVPPAPPLPDPLPEGAFARIRPEDWLPTTSHLEGTEEGDLKTGRGGNENGNGEEKLKTYVVVARVEDVPLQVLPGRQKEFRSFMSKAIFNVDGALAGLEGTAAVLVHVDGLPIQRVESSSPSFSSSAPSTTAQGVGTVELTGLPFRSSVRIGEKFDNGGWKGRP